MNEELYHLIDGELPDAESAKLFGDLANDPAQRVLFRQQMKLQSALHRNEQYQSLTSGEDLDILSRLGPEVGLEPADSPSSPPTPAARGGMIAAAVAGAIIVGSVAGFFGADLVKTNDDFWPQEVVRTAAERPMLKAPTPAPFNRDSVVASIRDSLTQAAAVAQQEQQGRNVRKSRKNPKDPGPVTGPGR